MENQVIHALISTEEYRESPDFMNVNLSDFALFLAVMKHKEAQECVLSIILDEPDLRLTQVGLRTLFSTKTEDAESGSTPGRWRRIPGNLLRRCRMMRLRTISGSAPGIIRDFLIHRH